MNTISWEDFSKTDIRVGTIIEVTDFTEALKPAWKLKIDFGQEIGIKKSSAQLKSIYSKSDLEGKQILAIVNFPPKQIGPFISECLVLGIYGKNKDVILLEPERRVENGWKVG